jgi:hypothetical protein
MPRLLKLDTQRRLSACQANLTLAISLLSRPKTITFQQGPADGAVEVGMIGVAADLAVSAALYEVYGQEGIVRKTSGMFLTASEAVDDFRSMLGSTVPRLSTLTEGISDPTKHLLQLKDAVATFKVLSSARAAAVHGGAGTSYEVAFHAGKAVSDFLLLLSLSHKWKPYLHDVPLIPQLPKERTLLAQELAAAALAGDGAALTGIFLVLPELSPSEPEWLTSLERVHVTPKANDISILIKSLQQANVGELHKVGKGHAAIPTIFKDAQNALPIYSAGYKKQFDNPVDTWQASIGIANSALNTGRLDLPTIGAIYNFTAMGMENIGLTADELNGGLAAHSLWPFVAASLDYQGTKGPCFFLIRRLKLGEQGQLLALLKKASKKSVKLKAELPTYEPLFSAVFDGKPVSGKLPLVERLTKAMHKRAAAREKLDSFIQLRALSAATKEARDLFDQVLTALKTSDTLTPFISAVAASTSLSPSEKIPVVRALLMAVTEKEDLRALPGVIANEDLKPNWTETRKTFQEIDFSLFGPQILDVSAQLKL